MMNPTEDDLTTLVTDKQKQPKTIISNQKMSIKQPKTTKTNQKQLKKIDDKLSIPIY